MLQRENPKQQRRENDQKVYVEVLIYATLDGVLLPFKMQTEHGDRYCIDKVVNIEPAASLKAGGQGMRYVCRVVIVTEDDQIYERSIDLYHDGDFWFVEQEQLAVLVGCA